MSHILGMRTEYIRRDSILCLPFFKSHFTYYIVWKSVRLIFNPKIIQICFIFILCCQTGICQTTFFVVPFLQSTVIEHFQIVLNNKWNNIVFQTLLEHNQSSHTTITVLERMNPLKLHMEVQNIRKGLLLYSISKTFILSATSSGRAVSMPPTSFGSFL